LSTVILICILIFILFEGLCSVVFLATQLHRPVAERRHTQYDALLGWVNIPNLFVKNMYGEETYLRTNAQGFRNNNDFSVPAPDCMLRVVCSGDSFTLGYGVENDNTWCQLLSRIDARWEPVNMGQGGYGIDQSYLWYMRDGIHLDHRVHVVALVANDFHRFGNTFLGYHKPYFRMQNDSLLLCNVPVPKRSLYLPWLTENIRVVKKNLRSVYLFKKILNMIIPGAAKSGTSPRSDSEKNAVTLKVFEELVRANNSKHITTIVVYLPTRPDMAGRDTINADFRNFLRSELPGRGLLYFDFVDDFKKLPEPDRSEMFIGSHWAGHYSAKGNQYIAEIVHKAIAPCIVTRLG
jgi:hypothetical protein